MYAQHVWEMVSRPALFKSSMGGEVKLEVSLGRVWEPLPTKGLDLAHGQ